MDDDVTVLNRPVETKYYSPPPDHVHTEVNLWPVPIEFILCVLQFTFWYCIQNNQEMNCRVAQRFLLKCWGLQNYTLITSCKKIMIFLFQGHHEGYDFWSSSDQGCIPLIFTPQLLLVWSRTSQRDQIVSNTRSGTCLYLKLRMSIIFQYYFSPIDQITETKLWKPSQSERTHRFVIHKHCNVLWSFHAKCQIIKWSKISERNRSNHNLVKYLSEFLLCCAYMISPMFCNL